MGELVQLVILQLISLGVLFGGTPTVRLIEPGTFETSYVSIIEAGETPDIPQIKKILNEFEVTPTDEDCLLVRQACEAVTTRAARLAAAGVIALV
ncbi:hypothetical protein, partial [Salmonella sp. s51228]|uniref:hypothetical protein n=1 Tax=Salmonella sp. s51228 TaxID=3159652 RepID=UPI0039812B5A